MKHLSTKGLMVATFFGLLVILNLILATENTSAQTCNAPAYDLDQGRNGNSSSPVNPVAWVNGNLNASQSHFVEGYSVPYRATITGLVAGQCYCIQIEWDIRHSSVNALDYITAYPNCTNTLCDDPSHQGSFMHGPECVDPLIGAGLVSPSMSTFPIPTPTNNVLVLGNMQPVTSFNSQAANEKVLTMWNGTITSAAFNLQGSLVAPQSATSMIICFTATSTKAVMAWGGHIASRLEWGVGNSAGSISGSPYHMRVIGARCCSSSTFTGGNQDRSLQASAVIPAPIAFITGTDSSCVGSLNNHMLTTNQPGSSTYAWNISSQGGTGAQIVGSNTTQSIQVSTTGPGEYIVCGTITINGVSGSTCDTISVFALPVCSITGNAIVCNGASTTFTANGGSTWLWSTGATTQAIQVDVSDTYTVTITDVNGCSSSCDKPLTAGSPFSLDLDVTDVFCKGQSTGSINLNVIGGGVGLVYNWSNGAATEDISGLVAGTYTVTVTDVNGCSATGSASVNEPAAILSVGETHTNVSCKDGSDGSIDITVSGGTAPYNYGWSNTSTDEDLSGLTAGNYNVLVTDFNGCTATKMVVIDEPGAIVINEQHTNVACNGGNDGTIDLSISGGTGAYTYLWNDNDINEDRSGLISGTYTVTVTDANQCSATTSVTISQAGSLVVNKTHENVSCKYGSDGSIDLSVSGGTPSYSFLWNDNETTEDRSGLIQGTYTVTVTDANGCSAVEMITVNEPQLLTIGEQHGNVSCFDGSNGSIDITVNGGTQPYSYNWNSGLSSSEDLSNLTSGNYTVVVTDDNGCTATKSILVDQPTELLITNADVTDVLCKNGNTGSIDITVSGGTLDYIFSWSNGSSDEDIANLTDGNYDVTIMDANGCTVAGQYVIDEPALLQVSETNVDILCFNDANGSIDLTVTGGTMAYNYDWSNGATSEDVSGLVPNTYTVTVTDANGCTASLSAEISEPLELTLMELHTNETCNESNDGSINLGVMGGTTAYSFDWSNGASSEDISGLEAGTYTVIVTDANNCSKTLSVQITQPDLLSLSTLPTHVLCNGALTGAIDLTANGGTGAYSYEWNNAATSEDLSGLAAGTYTVTVTDANGCTASASETIDEPTALDLSAQVTDSQCGAASGAIDLTVTGGVVAYSYDWSNGATSEDISGLTAGTYTVIVTDANGCSDTQSWMVQDAGAVIATAVGTDASCNGGSDGSADLTVSSGTPAYSFDWSNGATSEDISGVTAGTYMVTVTDANGCVANASVTIGEPSAIQLSAQATDASCKDGSNGAIDLTVSGGTGAYSYDWSNGAITEDISGLVAGTYTVIVTDANGCTATDSYLVDEPAMIILGTVPTHVLCNGALTGAIDLTANGGTGAYSYEWNNAATSEDLSGLAAGTYTVTVTDANGCTASISETITEPTALDLSAQVTDSQCGAASGAIDLTVTGGVVAYSYDWSNGATSEDISGLAAGTYTVIVTDANGCSDTQSWMVQDAGAVIANAVGTDASCNGGSDGSADLTVSGGTPAYSYDWSNGATSEDISGVMAGTYTVTVTDANGCVANESVTIGEPDAIVIEVMGYCSPCKKQDEAYATVTANGGTGTLTYLWSNGETTATINDLPSGIYTVTVTDDNGCSVSDQVLLDCDAKCQYTTYTMGGYGAVPHGNNPGVYVHANFANAFPNGLTIGCDNTLQLTSAQAVTDFLPSGSTPSMLPAGNLINPGQGYSNVLSGQLVAASLSVGFDLNDPAFSPELSNLADQEIAVGTFAGWTVSQLIDSANHFIGGCGSLYSASQFNSALTSLNENFDNGNQNHGYIVCPSEELDAYIIKTDIPCDKQCDGTATVIASEGTEPYTYQWSNGATTASVTDLCEGTYTVTVTDANGCQLAIEVEIIKINVNIDLSFIVTDILCNGNDNGFINVNAIGGSSPYNYNWSNGEITQSIGNLIAGTYTVTVTDANGCTGMGSATVSEPDPLQGNIVGTNILCSKKDDGSADLTVSGGVGPYSFLWSNGETTEDISGLTPGTYTVTITDANDCTLELDVEIIETSSWIYLNFEVSDILCFGGSTGAVDLEVNGGVGPYTFLWSNGAATEDISGLIAGVYTVTVTDANGCSNTHTAHVSDGVEIVLSATKANPVCGLNGSIDLHVSGGSSPYTYSWSNGATTQDISGLKPGTYTVIVTDANGCTAELWKKLWGKKAMFIKKNSITHTSDNVCDGAIDIKVFGGQYPFTYQWNNGATTEDISNLCAGVYKITVTDAHGCTAKRRMWVKYLKDVVPVRTVDQTLISDDISLMNIFPTPATESTTVQLMFRNEGNAEIQIFNLMGMLVDSYESIEVQPGVVMEISLDVNDLSTGTYIIAVKQNNRTVHGKIQVLK